jgi:hypothetical protein
MAEPIRISLRYIGPEVDNGEMDIDDVTVALTGFSRAYSRVSSEVSPDSSHTLKVTALKEGSFEVFILAAMWLSRHGDPIQQIETVVNSAKFVFELITGLIKLKKHIQGREYTYTVNGKNNTMNIFNFEKIEMEFPRAVLELLLNKVIDTDVDKIVAPLREKAINKAELKLIGDDKSKVVIDSSERDYFKPEATGSSELKDTEVAGRFISLNKERNSGRFELKNGDRVSYRYTGNDPLGFHADFSRRGQVRALVDAVVDESLRPISLNIKAIKNIQATLDLSVPKSSDGTAS